LTRTIEHQGKAWQQLLKQAEKSPVSVYYRGIDSRDLPLFEVVNKKGETICLQGTERQIMQALDGQP
jgi:hypothetical protein